MSDQPAAPVQIKPVPQFVTHVGGVLGPIDLKPLIQSPTKLRFSAMQADGSAFPEGLICTGNGLITGIAGAKTEGSYDIIITVENGAEDSLIIQSKLIVKERLSVEDPFFFNDLKSQIWQALGENLPVPEMSDFINRPITAVEIYYLLQRYSVLTIWDVYNLEQPGDKIALNLEGINPHYHVYDRGSCLVAAPKDLFSHERTMADALDVSRALAKEVYKRGWTIEFAGFNKMVRAAWVELQNLGDKHGKKLEILHYIVSPEDMRVYSQLTQQAGPTPG
jgi:hypothetical protein